DFSGGRMEALKTRSSEADWRVKYAHANPNVDSDNNAAAAHASHSRRGARDLSPLSGVAGEAVLSKCDPGRPPDEAPNASSANARSLADWKRRSGFFSKHRLTIFSSCGVTFPFVSLSSGGSSFRIEARQSLGVAPVKGARPASIS